MPTHLLGAHAQHLLCRPRWAQYSCHSRTQPHDGAALRRVWGGHAIEHQADKGTLGLGVQGR
eukprot:244514-Pelagomonas_calceolata.AAC.1